MQICKYFLHELGEGGAGIFIISLPRSLSLANAVAADLVQNALKRQEINWQNDQDNLDQDDDYADCDDQADDHGDNHHVHPPHLNAMHSSIRSSTGVKKIEAEISLHRGQNKRSK